MKKKSFVLTTVCSISVLFWILKSILGGVLYATAAFFTSKKLQRSEKEKVS